MDGVENEWEEEREKEGDPASGQEVEDGGEGYSLTIDCQHSTSTSHHCQYGQPDQSDLEIKKKIIINFREWFIFIRLCKSLG